VRCTGVSGLWLHDIESLEAISQDSETRRIFLRMADLARRGRLQPFLRELDADRELDVHTKRSLAELAEDETLLHAVEDYVHRTTAHH
jgi:hypothetical protein